MWLPKWVPQVTKHPAYMYKEKSKKIEVSTSDLGRVSLFTVDGNTF